MSLSFVEVNICKKGNLKNILSLVDGRYNKNKNKILCQVCYFGHLEVVKCLIEKYGADVRASNDYAIQTACENGHLEVVKYLVETCGVNARVKNDYAVKYASWNGHLQVVKYLVEKCGADARANDDYAVRWASAGDHFEVVKYLIEHYGSILPQPNPNYLIVCEKGEKKRRCIMVKRIYVQGV